MTRFAVIAEAIEGAAERFASATTAACIARTVPALRQFGTLTEWLVHSLNLLTGQTDVKGVWADTAYRSKKNEAWLEAHGRVTRIHRKKPKGKSIPERTRKANSVKSTVRAFVKHVFAQQKSHMGLFIRTIGLKRAETKINLVNLAYNMQRLIFHERLAATG